MISRPRYAPASATWSPAGAYGTTYVVRANGDVYPCIYPVGRPQYLLGNVSGALDHRPLAEMMDALHVDRRGGVRRAAPGGMRAAGAAP